MPIAPAVPRGREGEDRPVKKEDGCRIAEFVGFQRYRLEEDGRIGEFVRSCGEGWGRVGWSRAVPAVVRGTEKKNNGRISTVAKGSQPPQLPTTKSHRPFISTAALQQS